MLGRQGRYSRLRHGVGKGGAEVFFQTPTDGEKLGSLTPPMPQVMHGAMS